MRPSIPVINGLFSRSTVLSAVVAFSCLSLKCLAAQGQSVPLPRPQFEVASIKLHAPSADTPNVSITSDPGRITYRNVTVRSLIRQAYGLKVYPLTGGPDSLSTDRYDVIAKAPSGASKEQVMVMLQALLEDRFKLVVHRTTKELPIYVLLAAKSAPKLREVQDDGSAAAIGSGGGHQINAHHISMKSLAAALQGYVGDTVVDATGLTGLYDLELDFAVDESMSSEGPTVFEAVQRQLGLKLEARKGPVEVLVIDRVEKPSAN